MQRVSHDVFVSYSSKDKPTADAVCAVLEANNIRCWVAPRDILPGMDWGESIIDAIESAKVMVLVFSAHANASAQIKREVERAVSKGVAIIPLRIEEVTPSRSLEYFISTPHWLDAFTPPLERHLTYLAGVIQRLVDRPAPIGTLEPAVAMPPSAASEPSAEPIAEMAAASPAPSEGEHRRGGNFTRLVFLATLLAQLSCAFSGVAMPAERDAPWVWLLACILCLPLGLLFPASFPGLAPLLTPRALLRIFGFAFLDGIVLIGGLVVASPSMRDPAQVAAGLLVSIVFATILFVMGIMAQQATHRLVRKWSAGNRRKEKRLKWIAAVASILVILAPTGIVAYGLYDLHFRILPAQTEEQLADDASAKKDWTEAIDHLSKAIDIYHDDSIPNLMDRGDAYYNAKKYDQALADYSTVIARDPSDPTAFFDRGNVYYVKNQYDKAIADYDQAVKLDGKFARALYLRGTTKQMNGDTKGGAADIAAAKKLDPKVDKP